MNRITTSITAALFVAGSALFAQQAPAPVTEVAALKAAYTAIKNNVTKAAERMPEDQYGFKASPDIRTFGGADRSHRRYASAILRARCRRHAANHGRREDQDRKG